MVFKSQYNFGDIVFLKTDNEQVGRMITNIELFPGNEMYTLQCGVVTSRHYSIEFCRERNISFACGIDGFKKENTN